MLSKKAPPFVPRYTPGFAAAAGNTNPVYPIIHSLHTVCNPPGVTALQNPHECLTKQTAPSTMKVQQKAPLQSACRAKKMAGRCLLGKGGVPHWAADMPGGNGNGTRYAPPFWVCTVRSGFRAHSAAHSGFAQQPEEQAAVQQSLSATDVREMQQADAAVTALTGGSDYAQMTEDERTDAALQQLDALTAQGLVKQGLSTPMPKTA